MYTILIGETNEMITSIRERIMQRSQIDNLHFLVEPEYKGIPMEDFTVTIEMLMPISKEYRTETLVKSEGLYKDRLEYKMPLNSKMTREHGDIEIQLTFTKVSLDADGNSIVQIRKTSKSVITILPITAWSNIIPDESLSALDQRIIMTQAMLEAVNEMNDYLDRTKADNIVFNKDTKTLQLTANGELIGNQIDLGCDCTAIIEIHIDTDGNLVAIYKDGTEKIVGKTGSDYAGVYIPAMSGNGILTFTLKTKPQMDKYEFDINTNKWNELSGPEESSSYIWEEL